MKIIKKLFLIHIFSSSLLLVGCASVQNSIFDMGVGFERSLSGLEKKHIQIADHDWTYLEAGDPSLPSVLLLHGFAAEKDNWTRMVRYLDGFHVIAPDLPGHGETTFDEHAQYGFDRQSLRLAEFVSTIGLKKFHLVGNSMGGAIAGLYAYRNPNQVLSVSLIDAVGFYGNEPSELQLIVESKQKNPLIVRSKEDMEVLMHFAMHQVPFLPWPATDVLARRAISRAHANDQIFQDIYQESEAARYSQGFTNIFSRLTMPAFVLWGEKDRVLHVSSVDEFFKYIPNVQVDVLPNIGHAPMLEVPEHTAVLLNEFWSSVTSSDVIAIQE